MANNTDNTAVAGHTPVSNLGNETNGTVVGKTISDPPSEGPNADAAPPRADGTESLQGHALLESVTADLFVAPVDRGLPDIGQASFGASTHPC
jgi:hypothetical protein